jgi:ABC-type amino acid transport substrate-binding protein
MNATGRRLWVLLALFAASPALAQGADAWARVTARGYLIVAVDDDFRPMSFLDANRQRVGLEIDIAEELGRRLKLGIRLATPEWRQLVAEPWRGRWDVAIASIAPLPERRANLDFPAVYRMAAAVLVVPFAQRTIQRPVDARGRRIGVLTNSTYERYLKGTLRLAEDSIQIRSVIEDPVVVTYLSENLAFNDLAGGKGDRIDAMVTDLGAAQAAIERGLPLKIVPGLLFVEPTAVAVERGQPRLAQRIGDAVKGMVADGTISGLTRKWLGMDLAP